MKRILALALLLACSGTAFAHDVAVWAEVVKGKIHVEAYFSDGSPVGDSPVRVTNAEGKILLTGRTNAKGVFDFVPPAKTELTITVLGTESYELSGFVITSTLDGRRSLSAGLVHRFFEFVGLPQQYTIARLAPTRP